MLNVITRDRVQEVYQNLHGMNEVLARAVSTFYFQEAVLFDSALKDFTLTYPDYLETVNNLSLKMVVPMEFCGEFIHQKLPLMQASVESKRNAIKAMRESVRNYPAEYRELSNGMIAEEEERANQLETMVRDSKTGLGQFLDFNGRVFQGISNRVSKRTIFTLEDYEMSDISIRNEIYRDALGKNSSLLGYEVRLPVQFALVVAQDNARRVEMYNSLDADGRSQVQKHKYTMPFPEPLGVTDISGKTVFEKLISDSKENARKSEELLKTVNYYFDKRLGEISA